MLNISPDNINNRIEQSKFRSFDNTELPSANRMFARWLQGLFVLFVIILFLPWTQNIRAKGKLTTKTPDQRPQTIQSTIAGRIEHWYVREGQLVKKGDTIVYLSETKVDYFDPQIVQRTGEQVNAKQSSIGSYNSKVKAMEDQISAFKGELINKKEQLTNKVSQEKLKIEIARNELEAAKINFSIAEKQMIRTDELYNKGLKSLTEQEEKRMKRQETQAKLVGAQNKLDAALQELENAKIQLNTIENEYLGKIAKAESDKFSTLSDRFEAEGSVSKLKIQYENYIRRNTFYYIVAPQDCYVVKVMTPGIGETVKESQEIVSILPAHYELAVEMYVDPVDLPLIAMGRHVRFIFDGWPAFVFSGWPNQSFGTYGGSIYAIDNFISSNGKYRILVAPAATDTPWPTALRPGSGAQSIALLNDVPVWYELWRQLNGFPPDFYTEDPVDDKKKNK
ncbi:MAG: HlyD family secretion protein [Saprospiraceae bacterium]